MAGLLLLVQQDQARPRDARAPPRTQTVAGLMGVNPNFVISATFMIGAALAALRRRDDRLRTTATRTSTWASFPA